jgi:hypothetical protein
MSDVPAQAAEAARAPRRQPDPQPLPPPTSLRGREDRPEEERPTTEVLAALAADKPVNQAEASSALEWFLSEEPEEDEAQTHTIELNVGVGDQQHWITWIVRPIDSDELRRIQRQTANLRRRGRQDDLAIDQLGNLKVIIAGSVEPDIQAIADQKAKQPEAVLLQRFVKKPGLIAQLAGQIMALSGFDDEDVRDALSARG